MSKAWTSASTWWDAALRRWSEALAQCNRALELDRHNWRTFNNRAAVFVGLAQYDLAMTDVNVGLTLAPDSQTLRMPSTCHIMHLVATTNMPATTFPNEGVTRLVSSRSASSWLSGYDSTPRRVAGGVQ